MATTIQRPRLLATKEVARALGCSTKTVRRTLVATGVLTPIRLTPQGHMRFRPEDVERLIAGIERVRSTTKRAGKPASTTTRLRPG